MRPAGCSEYFVQKCTSIIQFIAHAFISSFYGIHQSDASAFDLSSLAATDLLEGATSDIEDIFVRMQRRISREKANIGDIDVRPYSRYFVKVVKDGFDVLWETLYPEYDCVEQTPLRLYLDQFLDHYNGRAPAYTRVGYELFLWTEIQKHITTLFDPNVYQPWLAFEVSPIYSDRSGSLSLGRNLFPGKIKHLIRLHVNPRVKGEELKYLHFHGLRASIVHELLSHCALSEMKKLNIAEEQLNRLESCDYISHGWFSFYAFRLSEALHMKERNVTRPLQWDLQKHKECMDWLLGLMEEQDNRDGIEGFKHAKSIHSAFMIGPAIDTIMAETGHCSLLKTPATSAYEKADWAIQKLLRGVLCDCITGNDLPSVRRALGTLYRLLSTDSIDIEGSVGRNALVAFFDSDHSSLRPIIDVFKENQKW